MKLAHKRRASSQHSACAVILSSESNKLPKELNVYSLSNFPLGIFSALVSGVEKKERNCFAGAVSNFRHGAFRQSAKEKGDDKNIPVIFICDRASGNFTLKVGSGYLCEIAYRNFGNTTLKRERSREKLNFPASISNFT